MSVNDKPKAPEGMATGSNVWAPDPWYARSEQFYGKIYAGGKCKYCGCPILTDKDFCDCAAMKRAREEFKRDISGRPAPAEPTVPIYNPNAHIEPKESEAVF